MNGRKATCDYSGLHYALNIPQSVNWEDSIRPFCGSIFNMIWVGWTEMAELSASRVFWASANLRLARAFHSIRIFGIVRCSQHVQFGFSTYSTHNTGKLECLKRKISYVPSANSLSWVFWAAAEGERDRVRNLFQLLATFSGWRKKFSSERKMRNPMLRVLPRIFRKHATGKTFPRTSGQNLWISVTGSHCLTSSYSICKGFAPESWKPQKGVLLYGFLQQFIFLVEC